MTSMKAWEKKVLNSTGAPERVQEIEEELRLAAGLTKLRENAGLSQRELAERIGVRQPRIAAIERSRNVTFDVLERYIAALGGSIELTVLQNGKRVPLITPRREARTAKSPTDSTATKTARTSAAVRRTGAKTQPTSTPRNRRASTSPASASNRTAARKMAT
jgi:transcriptional regulator with XRE-family HTH domain